MLHNRTCCLLLCLVAVALGRAAAADDFRIHTQLFEGEGNQPISENTTLFKSGIVYDYSSGPAVETQVTVFDPARARFILLDPQRKLRTEKSTDDILSFARQVQNWAANHNDPFLQFQANPKFTETTDPATGELIFSSQWQTYRVAAQKAANAATARQYALFSDWYARMNMLKGSTILPFPRLRVNEVLRKDELVPTEVQLKITRLGKVPGQQNVLTLRTKHHVVWGLKAEDQKRLEQTAADLVNFVQVEFEDFARPKSVEANETKKNAAAPTDASPPTKKL